MNKPLIVAIALLISFPAAYGADVYELKPAIGQKKRNKAERVYDFAVKEKRAHPKVWKTSVFGAHVIIGTLQALRAIVGLKR